MKTTEENAIEIARLVEDGKGKDVVLLNVSELNSWTDFFVIATTTSGAQWQGIFRDVKEYAKENDMDILVKSKRLSDGDDWNLIDLGNVVVHLMSDEVRSFYDLEKLWQMGKTVAFRQ